MAGFWRWLTARWRRRPGTGHEDERLARLAERLGQLEVRVTELEVAGVATRADGSAQGWHAGVAERIDRYEEADVRDEVEELPAVAGEAMAVTDGEPLEKAQGVIAGADAEGTVEMGMTEVSVRPGVPQGIPGQQARRQAARLWEGVL